MKPLMVVLGIVMTLLANKPRVILITPPAIIQKPIANIGIINRLIQCESQGQNVARMDSNHQLSYGILQFQSSTWSDFSRLSGIMGSPMNESSAIEMANWAISNGYLGRWTCAHILHLVY